MKGKKIYIYEFVMAGVLAILLSGCYYDIEEELYPDGGACNFETVSYSVDLLPVFQANCYTCHDMNTGFGGVFLEPYSAVKTYVDNGLLSCSIKHAEDCSAMPQNGPKLLACQISQIDKWISDGAPNN